jgi:hypothetical protein
MKFERIKVQNSIFPLSVEWVNLIRDEKIPPGNLSKDKESGFHERYKKDKG